MASLSAAIGGFFRWWFGELRDTIPPFLRGGRRRRRRVLWIEIGDRSARFGRVARRRTKDLGEVALTPGDPAAQYRDIRKHMRRRRIRPRDLDLQLSRDQALRQVVVLPAAARENLREVLSFEMDRHTPFKADEVVFDYRVLGTDQQRKQMDVDLAVAKRDTLAQALATARSWKLNPKRVGVEGGELDLLSSARHEVGGSRGRGLTAVLGVVTAGLFVAAALAPLQTQRELLAEAEEALRLARSEAVKVDDLRRQASKSLQRSEFLIGRKRNTTSVSELLNEVTGLLPDDTWVVQFSRRDDQLTLSGFSAKASALIELLEQSDLLTDVRFRSPVNLDPRIQLERFNLSALVAAAEAGTENAGRGE